MARTIKELNADLQVQMNVLSKALVFQKRGRFYEEKVKENQQQYDKEKPNFQKLQDTIDEIEKVIETDVPVVDLRRSERLLKTVEERKKKLEEVRYIDGSAVRREIATDLEKQVI
jgi:hypothetical protein